MSSDSNYLVLYRMQGVNYKLCRILFSSDGSYYVTSPYHPGREALLIKATINYSKQEMMIPFSEAIELAALDDENRQLKLSHHPDGFVQFSGRDIVSGREPDGAIRGIGVMSWPLRVPAKGPAFSVVVKGAGELQTVERAPGNVCTFDETEVAATDGDNIIVLEGHYFPPAMRRFIRMSQEGRKVIQIVHPTGLVLALKVIEAVGSSFPGFIGLELYRSSGQFGDFPSAFTIGSPSGNIRKNEHGEKLGDAIFCIYPRGAVSTIRNLKYQTS